MTNQSAIDYFFVHLKSSGTDDSVKEPYEMAIAALKKQVPEEPNRENGRRYCKACGNILAKRYYAYCPHCGQKVKKKLRSNGGLRDVSGKQR